MRRVGEKVGASDEQTRKLSEFCRLRDVPIITFVNKFDREDLPMMMILKSPVSSVMFRDMSFSRTAG